MAESNYLAKVTHEVAAEEVERHVALQRSEIKDQTTINIFGSIFVIQLRDMFHSCDKSSEQANQ